MNPKAEGHRRVLRSDSAMESKFPSPVMNIKPVITNAVSRNISRSSSIRIVPPRSALSELTPSETRLLRRKQAKLISTASSTLEYVLSLAQTQKVLASTFIFAGEQASTAICIDPAGWVLTCAHCFGDNQQEYRAGSKRRWLLQYTGQAVQVECRIWDGKRDLALLKIIAVESTTSKEDEPPTFCYVPLSARSPKLNSSIICIGQPGADDLEVDYARKTNYNLIETSEGMFRGMVLGADPQDNSDIGSLMHDAWTYWGHSGAPLLSDRSGDLVGLHSSWDDSTGMRHGIPLVAIKSFLSENLVKAKNGFTTGGET